MQEYILQGREGKLLDIIKPSRAEDLIDFTRSLVDLLKREYIHTPISRPGGDAEA